MQSKANWFLEIKIRLCSKAIFRKIYLRDNLILEKEKKSQTENDMRTTTFEFYILCLCLWFCPFPHSYPYSHSYDSCIANV